MHCITLLLTNRFLILVYHFPQSVHNKAHKYFHNYLRICFHHRIKTVLFYKSPNVSPLECFKALDDIFDVKPEEMHLSKTHKMRYA